MHATAIRYEGTGLLIRGPSGSGKSRLAMALLEQAGAVRTVTKVTDGPRPRTTPLPLESGNTALIGDDYLHLDPTGDELNASPAEGLEGLIEVRGLGILALPWCTGVPVHLVVDLVPMQQMMRLPEHAATNIMGHSVEQVSIPIGDLAHQMLLARTAMMLLPCG